MAKVAVVYWSGTGNTEKMAEAVAEGAKSAGADVDVMGPADFNADNAQSYDAIAFGCPAMGAEQLEEEVFEPMFNDVKGKIGGKKVAIFGSYGWGEGDWMKMWEDDCKAAGINLIDDGLMAHETPDADALDECSALGQELGA